MFRQNKKHKPNEPAVEPKQAVSLEAAQAMQALEAQRKKLENKINEKNAELENAKQQQQALANHPADDIGKENRKRTLAEKITKKETELEALRKQLSELNAKIQAQTQEAPGSQGTAPFSKPQPDRQTAKQNNAPTNELRVGLKQAIKETNKTSSFVNADLITKVFKDYSVMSVKPEHVIATKETAKVEFIQDKIKVSNGDQSTYEKIAKYAQEFAKLNNTTAVISINDFKDEATLKLMRDAFKAANVEFVGGNEKVKLAIAKLDAKLNTTPSNQATAANGVTPAANAPNNTGTASPQAPASAAAEQKPNCDAHPASAKSAASTTSAVAGDAALDENNPDEGNRMGLGK